MLLNIQSKLLFCLLFGDIDFSCYPSVAFLKSVSIFKTSSFLLAVSRRYFFCGSFFFILCLSLPYGRVCVMQPYGHLLRKGRLPGSHICDVFLWRCHFPIRYYWPDVVLYCIDSASLLSSLLSFRMFVVLRLCFCFFRLLIFPKNSKVIFQD